MLRGVSDPKQTRPRLVRRLTYATIGGSLGAAAALFVTHVITGSQLALAQAADSMADTMSGVALVWAVRESAKPPDAGHPLGHARAEPIAALIVAVLAGVLAIEVMRGAIIAIAGGVRPELPWFVAAVFAGKVVFKAAIFTVATRATRTASNPVLGALRVDARNDVLVGLVALVGFALVRAGLPAVDAWLAIVVALYVAYAGMGLARENVALLMGASAPPDRQEELRAIVREVPGVRRVDALLATWSGALLHVHCDVAVERGLSLLEAHAIGHAVEARLLCEDDVSRAVVHVGPSGE